MFGKKEKTYNLLIGKISYTTLKNNFGMIEREYELQIEILTSKKNKLNKRIIEGIDKGITNFLLYNIDGFSLSYYSSNRNDLHLNKQGETEKKKIMKKLNFDELKIDGLTKELKLNNEIDAFEEQLNELRIIYS